MTIYEISYLHKFSYNCGERLRARIYVFSYGVEKDLNILTLAINQTLSELKGKFTGLLSDISLKQNLTCRFNSRAVFLCVTPHSVCSGSLQLVLNAITSEKKPPKPKSVDLLTYSSFPKLTCFQLMFLFFFIKQKSSCAYDVMLLVHTDYKVASNFRHDVQYSLLCVLLAGIVDLIISFEML